MRENIELQKYGAEPGSNFLSKSTRKIQLSSGISGYCVRQRQLMIKRKTNFEKLLTRFGRSQKHRNNL
jgi:hypothetical protein